MTDETVKIGFSFYFLLFETRSCEKGNDELATKKKLVFKKGARYTTTTQPVYKYKRSAIHNRAAARHVQ